MRTITVRKDLPLFGVIPEFQQDVLNMVEDETS